MKEIFEYMFYSLAKINYRGKNSERVTVSLSAVQSLILLNILIFLYGLIFGSLPKISKIIFGIMFFAFYVPLDFYNKKKYKRKYQEFHLRWKNDNVFIEIIKFFGITIIIIASCCLVLVNYWIFK